MTAPSKKRILLITNTLLKGGAEKQCVLLANYLSGYHEVSILVFSDLIDSRLFSLIDLQNVETYVLKGNLIKKLSSLSRLLVKSKPDVMISFLLTSNFLCGIWGSLYGVNQRITGIRTDKIKGWKFFAQWLIHRLFATQTIFNNHTAAQSFCRNGFDDSKSRVIQNGIEIPKISKKPSTDFKTVRILTVARFVKEKDLTTALYGIAITRNRWPDYNFKYKIVGYGELEAAIKSEIFALGLEKIVNVAIDPEDLNRYFLEADLYLSSSINEGLSNAILEAMSYRLPVIATDVGDNAQVIAPGKNGFIIPKKNPQAIADAIGFFIEDQTLLDSMGSLARKSISENFAIEKMGLEFRNLVESN